MEKLRNLRRKYFSPEMSMKALFAFCLIYAIVAGVALFKISNARASEFDALMDKYGKPFNDLGLGINREQQRAGIYDSCSSVAIINTVSEMNADGHSPTDPAYNLINQVSEEECVPCSSDRAEDAISDTLTTMVAYGHMPLDAMWHIMDQSMKRCGLDGIFE